MSIEQHSISAYKIWRDIYQHIPKHTRYGLAGKIDTTFIEIIEFIYSAHYLSRDQKLPFLDRAIKKTDLLKFFLQITWEVKDVDTKKYSTLSEPINEIGRMLGAWRNNILSDKKLQPPDRRLKNV